MRSLLRHAAEIVEQSLPSSPSTGVKTKTAAQSEDYILSLLADVSLKGGPTHRDEVVASSGGRLLGSNSFYGRTVRLRWYRRDALGEMSEIVGCSSGVYHPTVDDVGYGLAVECSASTTDTTAAPDGVLRKFVQIPQLRLSPATHGAVVEVVERIRRDAAPWTVARVEISRAHASADDAARDRGGKLTQPFSLEIGPNAVRLEPLSLPNLSHAFADLDEAEGEDEASAGAMLELLHASKPPIRAAGDAALVLPAPRQSDAAPQLWLRIVLDSAEVRDLAVLTLRALSGLDLDKLLAPDASCSAAAAAAAAPTAPPRPRPSAAPNASPAPAAALAPSAALPLPLLAAATEATDATDLRSVKLADGSLIAHFPSGPLGIFLCSHLPVAAPREDATHVLAHSAVIKRFDDASERGQANRDRGVLEIGNFLIAVNGQSTKGKSFADTIGLVKAASRPLKLTFNAMPRAGDLIQKKKEEKGGTSGGGTMPAATAERASCEAALLRARLAQRDFSAARSLCRTQVVEADLALALARLATQDAALAQLSRSASTQQVSGAELEHQLRAKLEVEEKKALAAEHRVIDLQSDIAVALAEKTTMATALVASEAEAAAQRETLKLLRSGRRVSESTQQTAIEARTTELERASAARLTTALAEQKEALEATHSAALAALEDKLEAAAAEEASTSSAHESKQAETVEYVETLENNVVRLTAERNSMESKYESMKKDMKKLYSKCAKIEAKGGAMAKAAAEAEAEVAAAAQGGRRKPGASVGATAQRLESQVENLLLAANEARIERDFIEEELKRTRSVNEELRNALSIANVDDAQSVVASLTGKLCDKDDALRTQHEMKQFLGKRIRELEAELLAKQREIDEDLL